MDCSLIRKKVFSWSVCRKTTRMTWGTSTWTGCGSWIECSCSRLTALSSGTVRFSCIWLTLACGLRSWRTDRRSTRRWTGASLSRRWCASTNRTRPSSHKSSSSRCRRKVRCLCQPPRRSRRWNLLWSRRRFKLMRSWRYNRTPISRS